MCVHTGPGNMAHAPSVLVGSFGSSVKQRLLGHLHGLLENFLAKCLGWGKRKQANCWPWQTQERQLQRDIPLRLVAYQSSILAYAVALCISLALSASLVCIFVCRFVCVGPYGSVSMVFRLASRSLSPVSLSLSLSVCLSLTLSVSLSLYSYINLSASLSRCLSASGLCYEKRM